MSRPKSRRPRSSLSSTSSALSLCTANVTPGCLSRNPRAARAISAITLVSPPPMAIVPATELPAATSERAASISASISSARRLTTSPFSVRTTPRLPLSNSGAPISLSRADMCLDRFGWLMRRRSAAAQSR